MDVETLLRGVSLSDEFDCKLGDPRRTRRAQFMAECLAQKPELSLPEVFTDPAELEASYRLLRNPHVSLKKLIGAHVEATARRCDQLDAVLAIHDTTEFSFGVRDDHVRENLCRVSKSRQGFYGHLSLAVSADGLRAPLGVLNCFGYVHQQQVDQNTRSFWDGLFGRYERESERWSRAIIASEERLGGDGRVIHVCDREADINEVFQTLHELGSRYVIRAYQGRKSADGMPVYEVPAQSSRVVRRTIELSARPVGRTLPKSRKTFAPRKTRHAEVVIRGERARFAIGLETPVELNVVEVIEEEAPGDEKPVHWILLTSESIGSEQELLRVVDIYRSRWVIEEFFKAIKTGCGYEQRQLDSATTLLAALGITLVLAWQFLLLRHFSRLEQTMPEDAPSLPATMVVTDTQLAVLMALTPKLKWPSKPTVGDVMRGVARLGGHIKSNGSPGWQVLGRGYQKLIATYRGVRAVAAAGLVINP